MFPWQQADAEFMLTPAGIQALSTLTNLEHLHLGAGMPVTDAGIVTMLRGMTRLVRCNAAHGALVQTHEKCSRVRYAS